MNARLASQLSRYTKDKIYNDFGYLLKSIKTGQNDTRGHPVVTESAIPLDCSFTDKPNKEVWKAFVDLETIEAEVRFVSRSSPDKSDQFKLMRRFGADVENRVFEVVGIMNRDAFGFVCALKAVTV